MFPRPSAERWKSTTPDFAGSHTEPLLPALEKQIRVLTLQLEKSATPGQPRGLGARSSVIIIDREVGDW